MSLSHKQQNHIVFRNQIDLKYVQDFCGETVKLVKDGKKDLNKIKVSHILLEVQNNERNRETKV